MSNSVFVDTGAVALQRRKLVVTLTIRQDGLGAAGDEDEVVLQGHRVQCRILQTGMESGTTVLLRIEGLSLDVMNRLSMVQRAPAAISGNMVAVAVADAQVLTVVFRGGITAAAADFTSSAQVSFTIEASSTCVAAARPIAATSVKGTVPALEVYRLIASKSGLTLRDHGMTSMITNPNLPGAAAQQVALLSHAVRGVYHIGASTLDIWPEEHPVQEGESLVISSETGMIGTPSFSAAGIAMDTLFNHRLKFYDTIRIASPYLPALGVQTLSHQRDGIKAEQAWASYNGLWRICRLMHELESETPGGAWRSSIVASALNA